jgi:integrase
MAARRKRGEDSISFDHRGPCKDEKLHRNCPGRWRAEVSRGYDANGKRIKSKVTATSKTALLDKLKELHKDLDSGVQDRSATVKQALDTWLAEGLDGRSPKTIRRNKSLFYASERPDELRPEFAAIGRKKLRELNATQVRQALVAAARTRSTATVSLIHNCLTRAIRHAEARDLVRRNVAALIETPKGQEGRPSKSLTLEQAVAVIAAARTLPEIELRTGLKDFRRPAELMYAYIVLSLLVGVRTEEARALRWDHVVAWDEDKGCWRPATEAGWEHEKFAVYVWRSVRAGGITKTEKSRRTLGLPRLAVEALRALLYVQADERLAAGTRWINSDLVFASQLGTALDDGSVRNWFKRVTKAAGIGKDWTPRELRTTFVSILSSEGVPIEEIARLVGHSGGSRVTETVYRQELRPVIQTAAEVMDEVFEPRRASRRRSAKQQEE